MRNFEPWLKWQLLENEMSQLSVSIRHCADEGIHDTLYECGLRLCDVHLWFYHILLSEMMISENIGWSRELWDFLWRSKFYTYSLHLFHFYSKQQHELAIEAKIIFFINPLILTLKPSTIIRTNLSINYIIDDGNKKMTQLLAHAFYIKLMEEAD